LGFPQTRVLPIPPTPVSRAREPASDEESDDESDLESDRRSNLFIAYGIFVERLKAAAANSNVSETEYTEITEEFRRLAEESQYFLSKPNNNGRSTPEPRLAAMDRIRSKYRDVSSDGGFSPHKILAIGELQAMVRGLNSFERARTRPEESDRRFSDLFIAYGIFVKRLKAAALRRLLPVSKREYTEITEEFRRLEEESKYFEFDSRNIGKMTTIPRLSAMGIGRSEYEKNSRTTYRGALQAMVAGLNSYERDLKERQEPLQTAFDEKNRQLYGSS
jgi:hypothetical protein